MFSRHHSKRAGARIVVPTLIVIVLWAAFAARVPLVYAAGNGLDPGFVPAIKESSVQALAVQSDGKILVGGPLKAVNESSFRSIVRLLPDGSLDSSFTGTESSEAVFAIAPLANGKIMVGSTSATRPLRRLLADGTLDNSFVTDEFSGLVQEIYPLADGRVVFDGGGEFPSTWLSGATYRANASFRLLPDGSFDPSFKVDGKALSNVFAVDSAERVYFTGLLNDNGGETQTGLLRLLPNNTLDATFNPPALTIGYQDYMVVQPDGKLLLVGTEIFNGAFRPTIKRFLENGALDPSFSLVLPAPLPSGDLYSARDVKVQQDGKILLIGNNIASNPAYLLRFQANGAYDPSFSSFPIKTSFNKIALQADGKVLVAGGFRDIGIPPREGVVRFLADNSPPPTGPAPCAIKRYAGDGSGSWGKYSRTYYEAGTSFTLHARSASAARGLVFIDSNAVNSLNNLGSTYTAPNLSEFTTGFASSTANTAANWVEIKICGPATASPPPTPSPTPATSCVVRRYKGDSTGSWGQYTRSVHPAGTTFTLAARSSNAVRGMVWIEQNAITYLNAVGSSYTAPQQTEYSSGFNSTSANVSTNWVDIRVCTPPGTVALSAEEPLMRTDEIPEPTASEQKLYAPLVWR